MVNKKGNTLIKCHKKQKGTSAWILWRMGQTFSSPVQHNDKTKMPSATGRLHITDFIYTVKPLESELLKLIRICQNIK